MRVSSRVIVQPWHHNLAARPLAEEGNCRLVVTVTMRRIASLSSFVQAVESRKASVGVTEEMIWRARNNGSRRTPEKREELALIQDRARASGVEPLPANFVGVKGVSQITGYQLTSDDHARNIELEYLAQQCERLELPAAAAILRGNKRKPPIPWPGKKVSAT
jgi:hypothetical protein